MAGWEQSSRRQSAKNCPSDVFGEECRYAGPLTLRANAFAHPRRHGDRARSSPGRPGACQDRASRPAPGHSPSRNRELRLGDRLQRNTHVLERALRPRSTLAVHVRVADGLRPPSLRPALPLLREAGHRRQGGKRRRLADRPCGLEKPSLTCLWRLKRPRGRFDGADQGLQRPRTIDSLARIPGRLLRSQASLPAAPRPRRHTVRSHPRLARQGLPVWLNKPTGIDRPVMRRVTFRNAGAGKSSVTCSRRTPLARCQSGPCRITDASNVRRTGCERPGSQHSASPSRSSRWTSWRRLPQARSSSTSSPPASATGTSLSGSAAGRSAARLRWRSGRRRPGRSQRPAPAWPSCASAKKAERIRDYGASEVLDYHGDWPALVREITGDGAPKAVNAAPGQAATTLKAVADGGRLATITGDPPREERGVAVSDVYVRPDGRQLSALAELLAHGTLRVPIASVRPLDQAAQALRDVVAGADGAIVLSLRT